MYLQNRGPKAISMRYLVPALFTTFLIFVFGFRDKKSVKIVTENKVITANSIREKSVKNDSVLDLEMSPQALDFVSYAKTLTGTPYLYGSVDPGKGLDCSGFINAVSNHFGIKVPRSSVEFTNFGTAVETSNAKPGDLILFTGTDPGKHVVGHIGIITNNLNGDVEFIHSSSGKAKGVTVSDLTGYYETRLVKIIRIFPTEVNELAV
jgi:cell wall-associated NlpC family hydrolase